MMGWIVLIVAVNVLAHWFLTRFFRLVEKEKTKVDNMYTLGRYFNVFMVSMLVPPLAFIVAVSLMMIGFFVKSETPSK